MLGLQLEVLELYMIFGIENVHVCHVSHNFSDTIVYMHGQYVCICMNVCIHVCLKIYRLDNVEYERIFVLFLTFNY